jgi:hypothetical protein
MDRFIRAKTLLICCKDPGNSRVTPESRTMHPVMAPDAWVGEAEGNWGTKGIAPWRFGFKLLTKTPFYD